MTSRPFRFRLLLPLLIPAILCADIVPHELTLQGSRIACRIVLDDNRLVSDDIAASRPWVTEAGSAGLPAVGSDADFVLDVMYTDWQAPGLTQNAANPVMLTKKDFTFARADSFRAADGTLSTTLWFTGRETSLELRMVYRLERDGSTLRRKIGVRDTLFGHHFLRWIWSRKGRVSGIVSVVKPGGFGQPVAVTLRSGSAFFGLEYPAGENALEPAPQAAHLLACGQELGAIIGREWLESEWVVSGLAPDDRIKRRFFDYVNDIRVSPLRPYTLYNTWYDLRSPEYPKVPPEHHMSERTALGMARLLRTNMIDKHGITLDAFVLDDGWDVYKSDWVLRMEQWPNGFRSLAETLASTGTALGVWFGPTGGYSFRKQRIGWMGEHGYELVGDQLCIAGARYGEMLRKRVTDFVQKDGVGYYKWDGIQFSCSEPGHGHAVDIYSRRAVMESVIGMCRAVREKNPGIFLNITSGTWLSPWWVKYANTIWMQGQDYGYADVPSISRRDAAITYRDFVLYDDFTNNDFWFPIANLMTHGIIKGKLELLGSPDEPLDKFTDDVLLYLARGVSMYELYVSPDILSEGEWNTLGTALRWARDRFPVLMTTDMVGGNPLKRECYGYVHFKGDEGIIAARNPFVTPGFLELELAPGAGLDPRASSLVLERVYPTRWIAPKLHRAGESIRIPLSGYEAAIYEVYPVAKATVPLLAGAQFEVTGAPDGDYTLTCYGETAGSRLLNPDLVRAATVGTRTVRGGPVPLRDLKSPDPISDGSVRSVDMNSFRIGFSLSETVREPLLAVLLTPDSGTSARTPPDLAARVNGSAVQLSVEHQEGPSQWFLFTLPPGRNDVEYRVTAPPNAEGWKGKAQAWLVARQALEPQTVSFETDRSPDGRPMPPRIWKPGETGITIRLGEIHVGR